MVTEVDIGLPRGEALLAHLVEREHRLDLDATTGPQGRETELAGIAHEDDASRDGHDLARGHIWLEIRMSGPHGSDGRRHRDAHRIGLLPRIEKSLTLLAADPNLLGDVVDLNGVRAVGGRHGGVGHDRRLSGSGADFVRDIVRSCLISASAGMSQDDAVSDAAVREPFVRGYHAQWADMDFNQHMANSAFLDYASDTRMQFLAEVGLSIPTLMEMRIGPVTIEDHVTYRREIRMLQEFTVDYRIAAHTKDFRRFLIRNKVMTEEHGVCATVQARALWVNLDERRPIRPPEVIREAMAQLVRTEDFEDWG